MLAWDEAFEIAGDWPSFCALEPGRMAATNLKFLELPSSSEGSPESSAAPLLLLPYSAASRSFYALAPSQPLIAFVAPPGSLDFNLTRSSTLRQLPASILGASLSADGSRLSMLSNTSLATYNASAVGQEALIG